MRALCLLLALPPILSFSPSLSPLTSTPGLSAASPLPFRATRMSAAQTGLRMGSAGDAPPASRREAFAQLLAAGVMTTVPGLVAAADAGPEITAKVFFDFKLVGRTKALENKKWEKIIARDKRAAGGSGQDTVGRIVIGLYGKEAPESVGTFLKLVRGELPAECIEEDLAYDEDAFGTSDRDKLTKRQIYRQCKAKEGSSISYQYSQVGQVVKGKRIDVGRMTKLYLAAPQNEDANGLLHDAPGVVSVRKGGGEFEFTIAPGPNPDLDKTNTVVGRVLEGQDMVEVLNEAPVSKGQFLEGAFKFTASAIGDVRAKSTAVNRPLQKITVVECGMVK